MICILSARPNNDSGIVGVGDGVDLADSACVGVCGDGGGNVGVGIGIGCGYGDRDGGGDVDCGGGGTGEIDLHFLRDRIKNSEGVEKVQGCLVLLRAWKACNNKKSYSSQTTFIAKSVRPVCNCLRNHHSCNVEAFLSHHQHSTIHNFYLMCKGNGSTCSSV